MENICAFKIIPKNESALAIGHQSGFYITKPMRGVFPTLDIRTTAARPTVDTTLTVTKVIDGHIVGKGPVRFQAQTWGGTRGPEFRITNGLADLIGAALPGDMLVIFPERGNPRRMAIEVIRRGTVEFESIHAAARGVNSGLTTVPDLVIEGRHRRMQEAVAEMEQALQDMPFDRGHNQPPELVEENPLNGEDQDRLQDIIDTLSSIEDRLEEKPPIVAAAQATTSGIFRKLVEGMAKSTGKGFEEFMKSFGKDLGKRTSQMITFGIPVYLASISEAMQKVMTTLDTWLASLNLL